jgi:hypothetical protein
VIKLIANDAHYEEGTLQYNPDDIRIWEEYVSEDAFEGEWELSGVDWFIAWCGGDLCRCSAQGRAALPE